jgi:hypothetical protein
MLMFTKRQAVTKLRETHTSASQILHHHWYTQLGVQLAQPGVLYGTKPRVNGVEADLRVVRGTPALARAARTTTLFAGV